MTVEEVLREMDAASIAGFIPNDPGATLRGWLEVLRPVLTRQEARDRDQSQAPSMPAPLPSDVENVSVRSGLPPGQLRDLSMSVHLQVDHEGDGNVSFEYAQVPYAYRLQALLSVMGVVASRIELAVGTEAYTNLLRGILARREREL